MPKNTSTTSKLADENSSAPSVFDFLYHDSRRIGSFLSQFEGDGHLQQLTRTKGGQKGKKDTSAHDMKGNLGVASGTVHGGTEISHEMNEGYSRVIDPYWANAREFLDYLSQHSMIQRDINSARMGQFTLVTGSLVMADMNMLKSVWNLPGILQLMADATAKNDDMTNNLPSNRHQRRGSGQGKVKQPEPQIPNELKLVLEMLPHLPHSGHMHIITDEFAVWATAEENSIVGHMPDLILKHGAKIAGQWSMLGILDALPFETDEMLSPMEMIRTGMTGDNLFKAALTLAPVIRQALGRPLMSYGMTPLLIFREVSA